MELTTIGYDLARRQIQDADVLLFRGQSWYSKTIACAGRSPYSHVGMAAWWHDRIHLLQSTAFGDHKPLLSSMVDSMPGRIDVWRVNGGLPIAAADAIVKTMIGIVGRGYGWPNLGRVALYHTPIVWRLMKPDMNDWDTTNWRPFCSEAVCEAYSWNLIDLVPYLADRVTEPGDLPRGGWLEYQFTIGDR
jgi:hypothetical protein